MNPHVTVYDGLCVRYSSVEAKREAKVPIWGSKSVRAVPGEKILEQSPSPRK